MDSVSSRTRVLGALAAIVGLLVVAALALVVVVEPRVAERIKGLASNAAHEQLESQRAALSELIDRARSAEQELKVLRVNQARATAEAERQAKVIERVRVDAEATLGASMKMVAQRILREPSLRQRLGAALTEDTLGSLRARLDAMDAQLAQQEAEPPWPSGSYCIVKRGDTCPADFEAYYGHIRGIKHHLPDRADELSDYMIELPEEIGLRVACHLGCGEYPEGNGDLHVSLCCR